MILIEDEIKQRLKDLSNQRVKYLVEFNYGDVIVKEIDRDFNIETVQEKLEDLEEELKDLEEEREYLEWLNNDLRAYRDYYKRLTNSMNER